MDQMRDFVRDRTIELQRLAADVHREHALRRTETVSTAAAAPATRVRLEAVTSPELECAGDECVSPTVARHAA
jgi:hypothetical protein